MAVERTVTTPVERPRESHDVLSQDELAILPRVSRATIERRRSLVIDHTLSPIRGRTQRGKSHAASDETPVTPQRHAARARLTLLKLRATHQFHGCLLNSVSWDR
jgi:hypothetical protein